MRKWLLLICMAAAGPALYAQTTADRREILQTLARQQADWNAGNVAAFTVGYWKSDSLMYIGKSGIRYGYRATLESYQKNYPDQAAMGTLRFEVLHLSLTGPTAAFMVGKWHLTRPQKGDMGGHFSLLWRKLDGHWVIVADHSS